MLIQLVLAVALITGYDESGNRAFALFVALVSARATRRRVVERTQAHRAGNALIVAAAVLNAYWFWTLLLPVLAIVLIVGVVTSESRAPASASGTT